MLFGKDLCIRSTRFEKFVSRRLANFHIRPVKGLLYDKLNYSLVYCTLMQRSSPINNTLFSFNIKTVSLRKNKPIIAPVRDITVKKE
jgi:hypothetical protein